MAAVKRLTKELENLDENPIDGVSVNPDGDDMFKWVGTIEGPEGTPYEDGTFEFHINIPKTYPKDENGPQFFFDTKIFHPNVAVSGKVDLPKYSVTEVLNGIVGLMKAPNVSDAPCDQEKAPEPLKLYKENKGEFNKKAKEWTEKYAKEEDEDDDDDDEMMK